MSLRLNNRDHRKLLIIDGKVAALQIVGLSGGITAQGEQVVSFKILL